MDYINSYIAICFFPPSVNAVVFVTIVTEDRFPLNVAKGAVA